MQEKIDSLTAEVTVLRSDVTELRATLEQAAPDAGSETEWTKVVLRGKRSLGTANIAGTGRAPNSNHPTYT